MLSRRSSRLDCEKGNWGCYNGKGGEFCVWCPTRGATGECLNIAHDTCHQYATSSQSQFYGWSATPPGNPAYGCNKTWRQCWDDRANNGLGSSVCAACPTSFPDFCVSNQEDTCATYGLFAQNANNCQCNGGMSDRYLFTTNEDISYTAPAQTPALSLTTSALRSTQCCEECQPNCDKNCMGKCWCLNGTCSKLGDAYYLPEIDIDSPLGGKLILKEAPKLDSDLIFVDTDPGGDKSTPFSYFKNFEELVSNYSESTSAKAGLNIVGFFNAKSTLERNVSNKIASTKNVQSLFKNYVRNTGQVDLEHQRIKEGMLANEFVSAFIDLKLIPDNFEQQHDIDWWGPYTTFLQYWGSHVLTSIMYGARLEYRETVFDSNLNLEDSLKLKVCAEIDGGISVAKFNAEGCEDINSSNTANQIVNSTEQTSQAWGPDMANPFDADPNERDEAIKRFMSKADTSTGGIKYSYTPIWSILEQIYSLDNSKKQRARNLKAAYLRLAYDCNLVMDGSKVIQTMKMSSIDSGGIFNYGCWNAPFGCQGNNTKTAWSNGEQGCIAYGGRNGACDLAGTSADWAGTSYDAEDLGNGKYRTIKMKPNVLPNAAANNCGTIIN